MPDAVKSSRYVGVCLTAEGLWNAKISVEGRRFDLGEFVTEFDAAVAYDQVANEIGREGNFAPGAIAGIRPRRAESNNSATRREHADDALGEIVRAAGGEKPEMPREGLRLSVYIRREVIASVLGIECDPQAWMKIRDIRELIGVCKTTAYRWTCKPGFPSPDSLSRYQWGAVREWLLDHAEQAARDLVAA